MIPGLCSLFYRGSTVGGFSASASPATLFVTGTGPAVTTAAATAMALGGTAPYTYAWGQDSGDPSITINSLTSAATTFSAPVASGDGFGGNFFCRVTDNLGNIGVTNFVNANFIGP